jgi:hypothetical protein
MISYRLTPGAKIEPGEYTAMPVHREVICEDGSLLVIVELVNVQVVRRETATSCSSSPDITVCPS